jgi:hypothetical protein
MPVPTKRKFHKLNPQRRKLLVELAKGKSVNAAAKAAGFNYPQSATRAMSQMRPQILEAMAKRGWDVDRFAEHQVELLNAKKTLFFQHEGEVTDSRTVKDNQIRLAAQDQCLKMLGVYAPVNVEHSGVIEHVLTEREKREAEASIKTLLLCENSAAADAIEGEFEPDDKQPK